MGSIEILERIINKGGIIGACAKRYIYNKELADQFILECYYQCYNNSAIQLWGEELIIDIQNFTHNRKKTENYELLQNKSYDLQKKSK